MTTLLIGRQDGSGTKSSRETCRILRLRRLRHGRIPHRNGIPGGGILQNMMMSSECFFFFLKNLSLHAEQSGFGCTQNTHPQRA